MLSNLASQRVKQGERLLELDATAATSELTSLTKIRSSLVQENQFYTAQMNSSPNAIEPAITQVRLPTEFISLTKSRVALAAENQLYRAQLSGSTSKTVLNSTQIERLQSNAAELNSRAAAAQ